LAAPGRVKQSTGKHKQPTEKHNQHNNSADSTQPLHFDAVQQSVALSTTQQAPENKLAALVAGQLLPLAAKRKQHNDCAVSRQQRTFSFKCTRLGRAYFQAQRDKPACTQAVTLQTIQLTWLCDKPTAVAADVLLLPGTHSGS
jgi:hypothetical protein